MTVHVERECPVVPAGLPIKAVILAAKSHSSNMRGGEKFRAYPATNSIRIPTRERPQTGSTLADSKNYTDYSVGQVREFANGLLELCDQTDDRYIPF